MRDAIPIDTVFEYINAGLAVAWFHRFLIRPPKLFAQNTIDANIEFYMRYFKELGSIICDVFND